MATQTSRSTPGEGVPGEGVPGEAAPRGAVLGEALLDGWDGELADFDTRYAAAYPDPGRPGPVHTVYVPVPASDVGVIDRWSGQALSSIEQHQGSGRPAGNRPEALGGARRGRAAGAARRHRSGMGLHPAQLPTRFAAAFAFFRDGWVDAARRLGEYDRRATGGVLDGPATAYVLARQLAAARTCGALDAAELDGVGGIGDDVLAHYLIRGAAPGSASSDGPAGEG